ncbi:pilus assembly protein PilQ [Solemya pervernicosa gill symbiont]|uniref:Pilus assembly protein PilQ n=1 Tax=Solemya pervernicosa gill symbiont TaxID=642797 RepID=A0A1T2LBG8_9GAMM|nr:pilus assembly protein PilQ [Solemya pervernicosa gill symbiont]
MLLISSSVTASAQNTLTGIDYSALSGDRIQLTLTLSEAATTPRSFTTNHPARIALDFSGVSNATNKNSLDVAIGTVQSIRIAEAQGRTRVVLNLTELTPYETNVTDNKVVLTITSSASNQTTQTTHTTPDKLPAHPAINNERDEIESVDFRRGDNGEGKIVIKLSNPSTPIDMHLEGGKVVVDFIENNVPEQLQQRLDVVDFATPVKFIETINLRDNARLSVTTVGDYEHSGYQTDNTYTVEFRPLSEEEIATKREKEFKGERLSLNFQNIEVRAILQLIADFTGLNIVVSDSVRGNLTLRLQNVPWDQALDIILKSKGLDMRQTNNVVMVAPAAEIAAREKLELEAAQQITELAPLRTEFIQINYAKASDISSLLKSESKNLLSGRGSVSVDDRTNILLVQETSDKLAEIRGVIAKLDIPVRQVMIESRIVVASNDFSKALGTKLGYSGVVSDDIGGNNTLAVTGSGAGADSMVGSGQQIPGNGVSLPVSVPTLDNRSISNTPIGGAVGTIAFALLGSNYLIDLELQAMQAEGKGEVVSNPRVVTSDQTQASIKQGVEIPYQEATSSGATSVTFKEAVLQLDVTPHITPDDRIMMDLKVSKDSPDFARSVLGVPPLDTREIITNVLVGNGETVVLGGVYEHDKTKTESKVPFFGDLPVVGVLFKSNENTDDKRELLIFVTPKILKQRSSDF